MAQYQYNGYKRPKNTKKTLLHLLSYLGHHKWLFLLVGLLVCVSTGANLLGTYLLKPVINRFILPGDLKGLLTAVAGMGIMYLCGALASLAYSQLMIKSAQTVVQEIRQDLFIHVQRLPLNYFDAHTHGELMSRFTNDVDTVQEAMNNSFAMIIQTFLTLTGTVVMMMVLSLRLSMIVVVFLALMFAFIRFNGSRSRKYFQRQQAELGRINGFVEEMMAGQKVEKVFNHEKKDFENFCVLNENLRRESTSALAYTGMQVPTVVSLSYLNYAVSACAGGLFALSGLMDLGSLASYLVYVRQSAMPLNQFTQQVNLLMTALAGAERIFDLMEAEPEVDEGDVTLCNVKEEEGRLVETAERTGHFAWRVPEAPGVSGAPEVAEAPGTPEVAEAPGTPEVAEAPGTPEVAEAPGTPEVAKMLGTPAAAGTGTRLVPLKGDVRFDQVVFGYVPEKQVLNGISLYAKPGQKIAFVGSTGAGKTTIINLINRFYEIQSGTITYDGIDIRRIRKDDLRHSLAMVIQETHLFTGTIADNIRYGKLDATDEEVREAARIANADSFIRRLPDGYDTMLYSDGSNLSQGQRQLLAIARAAVARPPVLILDEATSSIDTRTERLIEKGMDEAGRSS